jgi:hypothetical protein
LVIAYACCVGSWDKFAKNVVPRVGERPLFAFGDQRTIAEAYNKAIAMCSDPQVEALVLLHDDLEITDPAFEHKVRVMIESVPDLAVIGIAGARGVRSLDWWNYDTVGHQQTDSVLLEFKERFGLVDGMEGSLLVLTRWAIDNLRFDEQYDGFHGYDCDIVRQAIAAGKVAAVADIDTHHHTTVGWKSDAVRESWDRAHQVFRKKWGLT